MLGGSASSPASGAPFRTECEHSVSGWPPPPAHQNNLFNRGYGIYPVFPRPVEDANTLYTATTGATTTKSGTSFSAFLEPKKVPDYYPAKFSFTPNESTQFDSPSTHILQPLISPQIDSTGKTSFEAESSVNNYMATIKVQCEAQASDLGKRKPSSNDVIVIKREIEDGLKGIQTDYGHVNGKEDVDKIDAEKGDVKSDAAIIQMGQKNEPDSTEFKALTGNHQTEEITSTGLGIDSDRPSTDLSMQEVVRDQEKCDVKVVDLSLNDSSTGRHIKAKTPDSSCNKGLSVCYKMYSNENSVMPKQSPTGRTLSLSSNNGGCSRTTPVTFKQLPQSELPVTSGTKPELNNIVDTPSPVVSIKMEPVEYSKYPNRSSFFGFTPLNNFFNPNAVGVLGEQMTNTVPYADSFESFNRQNRENLLSPETSFLRSNSSFLSSRPEPPGNTYLSPKIGIGEFNNYKNCHGIQKIEEEFITSGSFLSNERNRKSESGQLVNSITSEDGRKNHLSNSNSSLTPCQVAEVTSASSMLSPKMANPVSIKEETGSVASNAGQLSTNQKAGFMTSGQSTAVSSTVGMSLTKLNSQPRIEEMKISMLNPSSPPSSPSVHLRTVPSPTSINASPAIGPAVYSGGMVCENRSTSIWHGQTHNPGLWQYSAAIDYPAFPPVGFQLVRDPITGHLLLIPASNIEALQRAVLWPTYAPASSPMILPPISLQPNAPHLLLDTANVSAVDFMTSDALRRTTTPQHRIIIPAENATNKRKIVGPALIKFEASEGAGAIVVSTCDNGNNIYTKTQTSNLSAEPDNGINFPELPKSGFVSVRNQTDSSVANVTPELSTSDVPLTQCQTVSPEVRFGAKLNAGNERERLKLLVSEKTEFRIKEKELRSEIKEELKKTELKKERGGKSISENLIEKEKKIEEEEEKETKLKQINTPHENIKQELNSVPSEVDISGLELLSNSIECLMSEKVGAKRIKIERNSGMDSDKKDLSNDACEGAVLLQNLKNGFWERDKCQNYDENESKNLGGLGLLCALAEQRFQEEVVGENCKIEKLEDKQNEGDKDYEKKEEEKKCRINKENRAICEKINVEESSQRPCLKDCDFNTKHPSERENLFNELEVINGDERCQPIDKPERKSSTTPEPFNGESDNSTGKRWPRRLKKSENEISPCRISLDQRAKRKSRDISPPVLERQTDYPVCKQEDILDEDFDEETSNGKCRADASKPPTLTPEKFQPLGHDQKSSSGGGKKIRQTKTENKKRKFCDSVNCNFSHLSKKRKVGRPKKLNKKNGNKTSVTKTVVAKTPKAKSNNQYLSVEVSSERRNGNVPCHYFEKTEKDENVKKIKPKLKAEPKIRESTPLSEEFNLGEWRKSISQKKEEDNETDVGENMDFDKGDGDQDDNDDENRSDGIKCEDNQKANKKEKIQEIKVSKGLSCILTGEHIISEKCPVRTLTAMGGLFYAGQLSAIRAPDVYGITIDGERGHRPHIYSREEILRDTILEVKPEKASDLVPGMRCCAYWSEQYRCLYPGTISEPTSPDSEPDERFVNVEFDDGDSGKINIDDIRMLPDNYPIIEYDPNPLQSLSKRRRRISGTSVESHSKERKSLDGQTNDLELGDGRVKNESTLLAKSEKRDIECERPLTLKASKLGRKHLKKKRKEKLKKLQSSVEGKKKHKKHRCSDEAHRHHKHHKKHKKHKHKHGTKNGNGEPETDSDKVRIKKKDKNKSQILDKNLTGKPKKCKERTDSVESRSKMAAFLPARQLWGWSGKGFKRPGAKGRARKEFYKTIQRGKERITVGDCAVFLSTGRPDRPYIGRIESMWESWGTNMIVRVKWFYHPEETVGCPATLEYPGALFESPHVDENDVQTISHKCEVLPLKEYTAKLGDSPRRYEAVYDNNDVYYLAGYYDPTNITLKMEPGVK